MTYYELMEWAFVITASGSLVYFALRWLLRTWTSTVSEIFDDQNTEL